MVTPSLAEKANRIQPYLVTPFGDAAVIPIRTFIETILPPIPSDMDFEDLVANLAQHRGPANQVLTKNGHLWGYSVNTPACLRATRAFVPLQTCAERVAREITSAAQTFFFSDSHRKFVRKLDPAFPDACFRSREDLCATETSPNWHSFAVPGVYQQEANRATVAHVSTMHPEKSRNHVLIPIQTER